MNRQNFSIRFNGLLGFLIIVGVFVGLFLLVKELLTTLWWIGPILFAAALLINYRTVLNYFKFVLGLLQRSVLTGVLIIVLSVVAFPILSGMLFMRALVSRKVRRIQQEQYAREQDEYVEFEDITPTEKEKKLDLPPLEKEDPKPKDNRYEGLF